MSLPAFEQIRLALKTARGLALDADDNFAAAYDSMFAHAIELVDELAADPVRCRLCGGNASIHVCTDSVRPVVVGS